MADIRMADLTPEELKEVRALEEKLGGICLLAVEKSEALYAVEAKMEANVWMTVDRVYPEIKHLKSYYDNKEDALLAKSALKNLIRGGRRVREKKRPIRVRQL